MEINQDNLKEKLAEIKEIAESKAQQGYYFERLVKTCLEKIPPYSDRFSKVDLWKDCEVHDGHDIGIDLVAKERDTEKLCAIQCKFYDPKTSLQKPSIDSFLSASGKDHYNERIIVTTTDNWSPNAERVIENQNIPCKRLSFRDFVTEPIEWTDLEDPEGFKSIKRKKLRPHQTNALNSVKEGFKNHDRGKMIMACGTGKTFTSLKIAEEIVPENGVVLFLVPSISLLSQTMREWANQKTIPQRYFIVCSDVKTGRNEEDISLTDLALPATTDAKELYKSLTHSVKSYERMTVIFSTYQSLDTMIEVQKMGYQEIDLVICDEAHRTTGVEQEGGSISSFSKIHDQNLIQAKKRLYMTATPRVYAEKAQKQAERKKRDFFSMDDKNLYGEEFYRLSFEEAIKKDLLSDYKVMILCVSEKYISKEMQDLLAEDGVLRVGDIAGIIGCYNGLLLKESQPETKLPKIIKETSHQYSSPLKRAVAFTSSIQYSKDITNKFGKVIGEIKTQNGDKHLNCKIHHIDGTDNSLRRNQELDWLREKIPENECRILSNARCLSEGVDVPALDAVIFFNPKKSETSIVQSVGRVMRKAKGKKLGYIILPIVVASADSPEAALNQQKNFQAVWDVLQAIRSHDNRFDVMINQLELNNNKPKNLDIIGIPQERPQDEPLELPFGMNLNELRKAIYGKIVEKCGNMRYWEDWAKDIAEIAQTNSTRIQTLLESASPEYLKKFQQFLESLQYNINPNITQEQAIEMLAQQMITQPVFAALFEDYPFASKNPVSQTMQEMLELLEKAGLKKETEELNEFYKTVRDRASGIDNIAGKQKIIVELYDKFFRGAFPKISESLGVVFTPIEIVDFILHSANDALQKEFGRAISDEGVHILDPFTGTGSFIVRLLQNENLIQQKDLKRKFQNELHSNEIMLLAYYIAAVNIESAYHYRTGEEYQPFPNILLTDTFQLNEIRGNIKTGDENPFFKNSQRLEKQNKKPIQVIVGNPPYSAGQRSENDANKNLKYPKLDQKITETYAAHSKATLKTYLYDSYIRSLRWASDRISGDGIVAFVTSASFLDGQAMDGLRKCLADDFSSIYCFDLRGHTWKGGEAGKKEGGNVFPQGGSPIVVTLFIKKTEKQATCKIHYCDIGDYLNRTQKLQKITDLKSYKNLDYSIIQPNQHHDWLNQRSKDFLNYFPLGDPARKKKTALTTKSTSIFESYSLGLSTNRDTWVYNFDKHALAKNMQKTIDFYNQQIKDYSNQKEKKSVSEFIDNDPKKISWSSTLKNNFARKIKVDFQSKKIRTAIYRPFCKPFLYSDKYFNERPAITQRYFPKPETENIAICVSGIGAKKDFSALIVDCVPDLQLLFNGQCFPFYTYQSKEAKQKTKELPTTEKQKTQKIENISRETLQKFCQHYQDEKITKWDVFYFVYGLLHSPEYKSRFASDLKKTLPRLPFLEENTKDFWGFSRIGKQLADLHLNYETVEEFPLTEEKSKEQAKITTK